MRIKEQSEFMATKLICSDIDGTLLDKNRELSNRTIAAVRELQEIPFILISSRMPQAMEHLQKDLGINALPLICYNGGLILDGDVVLSTTEISVPTMRSLAGFCEDSDLHLSLYHGREWYVEEHDYWANREANNTKVIPGLQHIEVTIAKWEAEGKGAHKIMCMGDETEIDQLVDFIEMYHAEEIIGYRSKPTYLEISAKRISKKTAIETLIARRYPDLQLGNVTAFGDNYNDVEMLQAVGTGVAVANANKEVMKVADHKTDSNKNDGVAKFLEREILGVLESN